MDTGEGRFERLNDLDELKTLVEKYPTARSVFSVGEELKIKESFFRVHKITPFGIKLKLLKSKRKEK